MLDHLNAASALREVLAEHIMAASQIAESYCRHSIAQTLNQFAAEARQAPPARMLGLAEDVAATIDALRAEIRGG